MKQEQHERVIKTSVEEFLDLSPVDMQIIDLKVKLALKLKQTRQEQAMTQNELAALLGTGQSRVAKMEATDSSVSTDLLIRSLFALGYTTRDIGRFLIGENKS